MYPKLLVLGFGLKLPIILTFSLREYKPRKCVLSYSKTKKGLSWLKKTSSSENQNFEVFAQSSMVLVHQRPFFQLIFFYHGFDPKLVIIPFYFWAI